MTEAVMNLGKLEQIGFKKVAYWEFDDDAKSIKPNFSVISSHKGVLYAFVCEREVKYIGKTIGSLTRRLNGYRNAHSSQQTNETCRDAISKTLSNGGSVDIYSHDLPDRIERSFWGHSFDIIPGLEQILIHDVKPLWNKEWQKKSKTVQI